jgi:diamine N-acetyltransferase
VNIRTAAPEDAAIVARLNLPVHEIHVEAQPEVFKPIRADDPELIAFHREMIANPDNTVYIAEVEAQPAGYLIARVMRRPENIFVHPMTVLYIDQISVEPHYRKQGCGEALIQAALDLARTRGIARVLLDVGEFNANAQGFFSRQGFRPFTHRMVLDLE